mgnify:CR=1 FL=1
MKLVGHQSMANPALHNERAGFSLLAGFIASFRRDLLVAARHKSELANPLVFFLIERAGAAQRPEEVGVLVFGGPQEFAVGGHDIGGVAEEEAVLASDLIVLIGFDPVEGPPQPWRYAQPLVEMGLVRLVTREMLFTPAHRPGTW